MAALTIRSKGSEQLISSDSHNGTSSYKFTYSVEIVPICKDDLVVVPRALARAWGNITYVYLFDSADISPLTICSRIGNSMHLLDPMTLQQADVTSSMYWRNPFDPLASVSDLVEFVILDIEPSGPTRGKYVLADAQVTRSNSMGGTITDDEGMGSDGIYHTRTHLGAILQPGDTVLGYHLTKSNFNNEDFEALDASRIPDVVLVKKTYPNRRKKAKARNWKLRSIAKESEDTAGMTDPTALGRGALGRRGGVDQQKVERDYELFLRDLEEDKEMRAAINLYRAPGDSATKGDEMDVEQDEDDAMASDAETEEDFPNIEMDELLEHMEELEIQPEPVVDSDDE
jgi:nonsense-mediated mRNA decay protein 3